MEQALEDLVAVQRDWSIAEEEGRAEAFDALYERRRQVLSLGHVDRFWLSAMLSHRSIASLLSEVDCTVLVFLADVRVDSKVHGVASQDSDSFRIIFTFAENQWFSDKELVKNYIYCNPLRGLIIEPTTIQWKPGQCLTERRPTANGSSGNDQDFVEARFFAWLEADVDGSNLGSALRERIYPKAISYYFGTVGDDEENEDDDEPDDPDSSDEQLVK